MNKDNQKKGNGFFSLKFCFLFLMFLFLFVIPINAENFGYGDSAKKFGYDTNLPSTGGGNTTIFNNNSYYNITANNSEPLWNANFTAVVWNSTGWIRDWSYLIVGLLSQATADTLYYSKYNNIANYYNSSNFNITSFYNSSNPSNFYNSSNFNISTFYNSSNPFNFWNDSEIYNGTICLLNGTGCPASSGITNGSSAYLNNLNLTGTFISLPSNLSLFNTSFMITGASNNNWSNVSDIELGFNSFQNSTDFSFKGNNSYSAWYQEFRIGNSTVLDSNNFWSLNYISQNGFNNLTPLYVTGSGNVGINVINPTSTLTISTSSSNQGISINSTIGGIDSFWFPTYTDSFISKFFTNYWSQNAAGSITGYAGGTGLIVEGTTNGLWVKGDHGAGIYATLGDTSKGGNIGGLFGGIIGDNGGNKSVPAIYSNGTLRVTNGSTDVLVTSNMNNTGIDYGLNASITVIHAGNLLNITSIGNAKLPPFTGAGNQGSFCSNATNSVFNGTIMKNNTGVYGCPMTASANWTKLF